MKLTTAALISALAIASPSAIFAQTNTNNQTANTQSNVSAQKKDAKPAKNNAAPTVDTNLKYTVTTTEIDSLPMNGRNVLDAISSSR